jgi:hypothetical protein
MLGYKHEQNGEQHRRDDRGGEPMPKRYEIADPRLRGQNLHTELDSKIQRGHTAHVKRVLVALRLQMRKGARAVLQAKKPTKEILLTGPLHTYRCSGNPSNPKQSRQARIHQ